MPGRIWRNKLTVLCEGPSLNSDDLISARITANWSIQDGIREASRSPAWFCKVGRYPCICFTLWKRPPELLAKIVLFTSVPAFILDASLCTLLVSNGLFSFQNKTANMGVEQSTFHRQLSVPTDRCRLCKQ